MNAGFFFFFKSGFLVVRFSCSSFDLGRMHGNTFESSEDRMPFGSLDEEGEDSSSSLFSCLVKLEEVKRGRERDWQI